MALARVLMEGIDYSGSVSLEGYDYSGRCRGNERIWFDAACESLLKDIYDVDKAYMMADVMGEVQVIKEGADPEVLLEGVVKGAIDRIVAAFKKFWAKIKEFFAKVKEWFKKMTLHGKEFATHFKDKLLKKNKKGFSYHGYSYNMTKGDDLVKTIFNDVDDIITDFVSYTQDVVVQIKAGSAEFRYNVKHDPNKRQEAFTKWSSKNLPDGIDTSKIRIIGNQRHGKHVTNTIEWDDHDSSVKKDVKVTKSDITDDVLAHVITRYKGTVTDDDLKRTPSEIQDDFVKDLKIGCSDFSELDEKLRETYRDDSSEDDQHDDFEDTSVSEMISLLTSFDKVVTDTDKDAKQFDKLMSNIISKFDKMDKKDVGDDGYKVAQMASKVISALLAVGKTPLTIKSEMYKEAATTYERVLKEFLSFKPTKESYDYDSDDTYTDSLFETAMNLI